MKNNTVSNDIVTEYHLLADILKANGIDVEGARSKRATILDRAILVKATLVFGMKDQVVSRIVMNPKSETPGGFNFTVYFTGSDMSITSVHFNVRKIAAFSEAVDVENDDISVKDKVLSILESHGIDPYERRKEVAIITDPEILAKINDVMELNNLIIKVELKPQANWQDVQCVLYDDASPGWMHTFSS